MIRLRTASGETRDAGADFVEILAADGSLAAVAWIDSGNLVRFVKPGDRDFDRYAKAFGLNQARVINLEPFMPPDP